MEFSAIDQRDITIVRRELDDLIAARTRYGWDDMDRDRYHELCTLERSLLGPWCDAPTSHTGSGPRRADH